MLVITHRLADAKAELSGARAVRCISHHKAAPAPIGTVGPAVWVEAPAVKFRMKYAQQERDVPFPAERLLGLAMVASTESSGSTAGFRRDTGSQIYPA